MRLTQVGMYTGPVLVRRPAVPEISIAPEPVATRQWLRWLRSALLIIGVCGLGYYAYEAGNLWIYQSYQNWAFDEHITGHGVGFWDYAEAKVLGRTEAAPSPAPVAGPAAPVPAIGDVLGRVAIPRLQLSAIVRQGADDAVLSRAVGHVPSTALAGQAGNFAIAAHRDTLFRVLKDIRIGDTVTFQTPQYVYTYAVFETRIVKPSDVSVLRPDGGLRNPPHTPILTMITCYPFYYIGSAPKRFIVQARLVEPEAVKADPPAPVPVHHRASTHIARMPTRPVTRHTEAKPKRHGFWHKVFHF